MQQQHADTHIRVPPAPEVDAEGPPADVAVMPPAELGARAAELAQMAPGELATAEQAARQLRAISIAHTIPTDWQLFGETAYLMRDGAGRLCTLWQLDLQLAGAFERETLDAGHVSWSVLVQGHSRRTGARVQELGMRSTCDPFFCQRYEDGLDSDRVKIVLDCKKAALTNGYGRAMRSITGLARVSPDVLAHYGIDLGLPGQRVRYAKGAKGGGGEPSDAQLFLIAQLACGGRVEGFGRREVDATVSSLKACPELGKKRASEVITWLKESRTTATKDELWARCGAGDGAK